MYFVFTSRQLTPKFTVVIILSILRLTRGSHKVLFYKLVAGVPRGWSGPNEARAQLLGALPLRDVGGDSGQRVHPPP